MNCLNELILYIYCRAKEGKQDPHNFVLDIEFNTMSVILHSKLYVVEQLHTPTQPKSMLVVAGIVQAVLYSSHNFLK